MTVNLGAAHTSLLDRWEAKHAAAGYRCFIRDGIIDQARWNGSHFKTLFLLKEAYTKGDPSTGFDLCEMIRKDWEGPYTKLWWRVATWAWLIERIVQREIPGFPEWNGHDKNNNELCEALLSAAVINVKKSEGRSHSDDSELRRWATEDEDFLIEQVRIIDPAIVVCGNTWQYVSEKFGEPENVFDEMVWRVDGRLFIDFWHPADRLGRYIDYYALAALLQQAYVRISGE